MDAAYNLLEGETLADMTLTGVIIRVDDAYSEQYKNVTVTIIVDGKMDKKLEWNAAYGLSLTLIWLYLQFLRLFAIIFSRKR